MPENPAAPQSGTASATPPAPDAPARRSATPVAYDFRRPTKLSRETARALEIVFETVARQWSTVVGSTLGGQCQVAFLGVEQSSYDDYVNSLPSPTLLSVFEPQPHAGSGFLQVPLPVGFVAIDHMLGGTGRGAQPDRLPTEIETALVRRLLERMLAEIPYGLQAVTAIAPRLRSIEHNPQFVQVAAAMDMFVVASFAMTVDGAQTPSTITFALPAPIVTAAVADNAGEAPDPETQAQRRAARAAMSGAVQDVPVEVRVRFLPLRLTSQRLLQLRVGDVLRLDHPIERPLDVVASGVVCARGVAGTQGSRAACLIVSASPSDTPSGTSLGKALR
jgi:flagellar motor switch protein FliM